MKRTLALILAVVMCLGLFAGCAKPAEPDTTTGAADTTAAPEETTKAPEGDKELTTVKVLCVSWDSDTCAAYRYKDNPKWAKVPAVQEFYDKLAEVGVELDYEAIDSEQYNTAVKTRLQTGVDLPDIINNPGMTDVELSQLGQAGIVADVLEMIDKYDEDGSIRAYWAKMAGPWLATRTTADGKMYILSTICKDSYVTEKNEPMEIPFSGPHHVSIREDWLQAIGKEWQMFYTPDELADVLIAMNQNDANGNGTKDEVIANFRTDFRTGFESGFDMGYGLISVRSNGEGVTCNLYQDGFADYVAFMKKLYDNGCIDTTVLNGTNVTGANRGSALMAYTTENWEEAAIVGYEDTAVYSPIFIDDDNGENGAAMVNNDNNPFVCYGYVVNAKTEHPEAVVKLLDLLFNEETGIDMAFGYEGVHYDVNEYGVKIKRPDKEYSSRQPEDLGLYTLSSNILPCPRDDTKVVAPNPALTGKYQHKSDVEMWCYENADKVIYQDRTEPYAMPTEEEMAVIEKCEATINTYVEELLMALFTGEKSMDDFDTYLEELRGLGLDEYIAVFEARHQRFVDHANEIGVKTCYN